MNAVLTCREIIEFLDDYSAVAQPPELRAEFERHLGACPPCRDYLRTYRETIRLAGETAKRDSALRMPEGLVRAILAAREKQE